MLDHRPFTRTPPAIKKSTADALIERLRQLGAGPPMSVPSSN
jgi:hypothetical protein